MRFPSLLALTLLAGPLAAQPADPRAIPEHAWEPVPYTGASPVSWHADGAADDDPRRGWRRMLHPAPRETEAGPVDQTFDHVEMDCDGARVRVLRTVWTLADRVVADGPGPRPDRWMPIFRNMPMAYGFDRLCDRPAPHAPARADSIIATVLAMPEDEWEPAGGDGTLEWHALPLDVVRVEGRPAVWFRRRTAGNPEGKRHYFLRLMDCAAGRAGSVRMVEVERGRITSLITLEPGDVSYSDQIGPRRALLDRVCAADGNIGVTRRREAHEGTPRGHAPGRVRER